MTSACSCVRVTSEARCGESLGRVIVLRLVALSLGSWWHQSDNVISVSAGLAPNTWPRLLDSDQSIVTPLLLELIHLI